jgi:putative hemolysin
MRHRRPSLRIQVCIMPPSVFRSERLFRCELPTQSKWVQRLSRQAAPTIEWLLGVDQINDLYDDVARQTRGRGQQVDAFLQGVLEYLDVRCTVTGEDLARVPAKGPLVVVANHPFGALEGLLLASVIRRVRPDLRIIANALLAPIEPMRELFLLVDAFGAAERNLSSIRQALRITKAGGAVAMFPAGEVSSFRFDQREVVDAPWCVGAGK